MFLPQDLSFNNPQAIFLMLLLIPLLIFMIMTSRVQKNAESAWALSPSLQKHLIISRSPVFKHTKIIFWIFINALLVFALMDPIGDKRYEISSSNTLEKNRQVVFLVDTSASMGVLDSFNRISRLDGSKTVMENILSRLSYQPASLYAFTSELTPLVPPTLDRIFTRIAIHQMHLNEGDVEGTSLKNALEGLKTTLQSQSQQQEPFIILFSDGGETDGSSSEEIINSLKDLKPSIHLITVGCGSSSPQIIPHVTFQGKPVSSKLEPHILQGLASTYRGVFYKANEWNAFDLSNAIIKQIENTPSEENQAHIQTNEHLTYKDYYQIPLGLALLFYVINLLLPDVKKILRD